MNTLSGTKEASRDLSRRSAETEWTDGADAINYRVMAVLDSARPVPIDFVVSSLVTHHMSDDLIAKFLRWMEETARKGWLTYDLQRHPVLYYFITLMGKLTRLHPMVIHDGRVSVARSLTRAEWLARIGEAGIARDAGRLRWFRFRFAIGRLAC